MSVINRWTICCLIVSLIGLPAAGEARPGPSPVDRPHPVGGTLIWGSVFPPVPFNPTQNLSGISMPLQDLIFNRLVRLNGRGENEPDVARRWEVSGDGLVYTFYLHEGIFFHDGVELTAEDVLFTYERIMDPERDSPYRSDFAAVDHFEAPSRYTFRIVLTETDPLLIYRLVREILPRHRLEGDADFQQAFYHHPVGSGPFRFQSWDKEQQSIRLTANAEYFEGRPYIDEIQVKIFPDNSAMWKAFMRHDVDLVQYINRDDYLIAKKDNGFRVYATIWGMYSALLYNVTDPIWQDRELRKAVSHAINTEQIMAMLDLDGVDTGGTQYSGNDHVDRMLSSISYNPQQAAAILDERGWRQGPSGIRQKDGQDLELRILVDKRNGTDRTLARIIRQNLAAVGIRTQVRLYEQDRDLVSEEMKEHPPQAWLRYLPGPHAHGLYELDFWYSGSPEPGKIWVYHNSEADRLIENVYELSDEEEKARLSSHVRRLIYEDQPASFLYFPVSLFAVNARVANTEDYFSWYQPTYTIKDWYITSPDTQP